MIDTEDVAVAGQRLDSADVCRDRAVDVLLCTARKELDAATVARLRGLVHEPVAWDYLRDEAGRHGVLPLLRMHLRHSCSDLVPQEIAAELEAAFHRHTRRNLQMTGELLRLLKLFEAHGITVIPYKGPVLGAYAYDNIALRTFTDLDILVRPADFVPAQAILRNAGYKTHLQLSPAQQAALLRYCYHETLMRSEIDCAVELHWGLVCTYDPFPLQMEELWEQPQSIKLLGKAVSTIAHVDLLLMLCVHGAKHRWDRLEWIACIGELLRVEKRIDWAEVATRARALGCERMLLTGCLLAHQLVAAPLPTPLSTRLRSRPLVPLLTAAARRQLFPRHRRPVGHVITVVAYFLYYVAAKDRLRDQIRYCLAFIITPSTEDYARLDLPPAYYYVVRPCRLVAKYILRLRW